MPAPSAYPSAYDDFPTNKVPTDPKTGHADQHNLLGAAIEGVQAELGLNPSGSWSTMKARLDYLWDETDVPAAGDVHLWDSGVGKFAAGKIGNIHIDSGASIGIAKLAGYPNDSTVFLRGDGTWTNAGGPAGSGAIWFSNVAPAGWAILDGATVVNAQSLYPSFYNNVDPGWRSGPHVILPDTRGRMLMGRGTHGEVASMGQSEGLAVGARRARHGTVVYATPGGGGGASQVLQYLPGGNQQPQVKYLPADAATYGGSQNWGVFDSPPAGEPINLTPYLVVNFIIKLV